MRRIVVVTLMALLAVPMLARGQGRPDLSGQWTFNPEITPLSQRELAPLTTLIIKQTATEISLESKAFQQEQPPVVFTLNGAPSVTTNKATGTTKGTAVWQGQSLVVSGTRSYTTPLGETTTEFKDVYSLENGVLMLEKSEKGRAVASYKPATYKVAFTKGPYKQPPMPADASPLPGPKGECPKDSVLFKACAMEKLKTFRTSNRAPDGHPDFEGFWQMNGGMTGTTPAQGIEAQPMNPLWGGGRSMVIDPPDGTVPYQPWAVKDREWRMKGENAALDTLVMTCLAGIPRTYLYSLSQWMRNKDQYTVLYEMHHTYRMIAMDGRPPLNANIGGLWNGSSRGHWDGETLVVETNLSNGKEYVDMQFVPLSDQAHFIERFTLIDDNTMYFETTVVDPKIYSRPWTFNGAFRRNPNPKFELLESACHEGNRESSAEGVHGKSDFDRMKKEAESRTYLK